MNVFVTGATGFIGQEIVRLLREAGHTLRFLAHNPNSSAAQELKSRYDAGVHAGDVLEADSLRGSLIGIDAVIHLVGIISEVGNNTFENVHTQGTSNMVAAAVDQKVRRFIHMSALGTRANANSRYHRSKWEAEQIVRSSGLGYSIFRPSLVYGPRDHFVNLFAKIIRRSPIVPVMGSPRARFQPVPVEAVAKAFIGALTEPASIGQTYDLCGSETLTLSEMIEQIAQVMQRRRLKLRVPLLLARSQAAMLEFIFPKLLSKAPPLNRDQLIMLQEDNTGDSAVATELFRLNLPTFRDGIAKYLRG